MSSQKAVLLFLRISIASVFLYAAIAATLQPFNWVGYIPEMARHLFPAKLLLGGFSAFELLLSIWLLTGWKAFYAALLASCILVAIILANISQLDILFRDFAIFFAAIALAIGSYKKL